MDIVTFKDTLFEKGAELGFSDMELYYQSSEKLTIKIYKNEVDSYQVAVDGGVSFRGIYNGQMGYAYTEKIDEQSILFLLEEARENVSVIDSEDHELIFAGSDIYEEINLFSPELANVGAEEKILFLKKLEEVCFSLSDKVTSVNHCGLSSVQSEIMIANSKGLEKREKVNVAQASVSVIVKNREDVKSGGKSKLTRDFSSFDPYAIAKEAVENALSKLGASSIESKEYPIILKNEAAAALFNTFTSNFSAEQVQKGKSKLANKINQTIAVPLVTIVDDPLLKEGFRCRSFDSEGVATKRINVVEKGVLKTYLHNLKTAAKDHVKPTGHGTKASYKGTMTISPSNMFITPGETTYEELIEGEDEAIIITNLQGLHSGANAISGDFSLSANGFLVKNGKIERPVNQITIAGNFYTLLKEIEAVANDLDLSSSINCPSLKVKMLAVSGD